IGPLLPGERVDQLRAGVLPPLLDLTAAGAPAQQRPPGVHPRVRGALSMGQSQPKPPQPVFRSWVVNVAKICHMPIHVRCPVPFLFPGVVQKKPERLRRATRGSWAWPLPAASV